MKKLAVLLISVMGLTGLFAGVAAANALNQPPNQAAWYSEKIACDSFGNFLRYDYPKWNYAGQQSEVDYFTSFARDAYYKSDGGSFWLSMWSQAQTIQTYYENHVDLSQPGPGHDAVIYFYTGCIWIYNP